MKMLKDNELPDFCYGVLPSTNEIIKIHNRENGYQITDSKRLNADEAERLANSKNTEIGVSENQRMVMEIKSMFHWGVNREY